MKILSRRSLVILIVAIAIIAATPWFTGMVSKFAFDRTIEEINSHDGSIITLNKTTYQRGWLTSKVEVSGVLNLGTGISFIYPTISADSISQYNGINDIKFYIISTVSHGPFFIGSKEDNDKTGLALVQSTFEVELMDADGKVVNLPGGITSSAHLLGGFEHLLQIPSHSQKITKDLTLEWLDVDFSVIQEGKLGNHKASLEIDSLSLSHKHIGKVIFKDIAMQLSNSSTEQASQQSKLVLSDEIIYESLDGEKVVVTDFSQESTFSIEDQDLAKLFNFLNLAKISSPVGELDAVRIGFSLNDFRYNSIDELINGPLRDGKEAFNPLVIFSALSKAVTKDSLIQISPVDFTVPDIGRVQFSANIRPIYPIAEDMIFRANNYWELIDSMQVNITAPESVVRMVAEKVLLLSARNSLLNKNMHNSEAKLEDIQLANSINKEMVDVQLAQWQENGILQLEKNEYKLDFNYKDSKFIFNGSQL